MQAIYSVIFQICSWFCVGDGEIPPDSPLAYAVPLIALFIVLYACWKFVKLIFVVLKNLFGL